MSKLAMTMALDALINVRGMHYTAVIPAEKAITALTAALAEPSSPVAWLSEHGHVYLSLAAAGEHATPLYTHPPVHQPLSGPEPYDPIGAWNKGFEEGKRLATPEPSKT
jgi:hypothetical protein